MATGKFETIISVLDKASMPVLALEKRLASLGKTGAHAQHAMQLRPHEALWDHMIEHVRAAHEHFDLLREKAAGAGERIGELLPMVGALGAAGSFAGLVEMAHRTAEAAEALQKMAIIAGTSVPEFQSLSFAAKQVGIEVTQVQDGMGRLNQRIANAAGGMDKNSAALFKAMGISLRDANGHLRSATQILPQVESSFERTTSPALRNAMAMQLFGRAGREMLPFLTMGPEKLAELQKKFGEFGYGFSRGDLKELEEFNEAWKDLEAAVSGVSSKISAELAPVMTPLLEQFAKWTAENRDWIALGIKDAIQSIGDVLKDIDVHQAVDAIKGFKDEAGALIDKIGGLKTVLLVTGGAITVGFTAPLIAANVAAGRLLVTVGASAIVSIAGFGRALITLVPAIDGVGGAFTALGLAMRANPLGAAITAATVLAGLAYELYENWDSVSGKLSAVWKRMSEAFDATFGRVERGFGWLTRNLGLNVVPVEAGALPMPMREGAAISRGAPLDLPALYGQWRGREDEMRRGKIDMNVQITTAPGVQATAGVRTSGVAAPNVDVGQNGLLDYNSFVRGW